MRLRPWHKRHDRHAIERWPAPTIPASWGLIESTDGPRISYAIDRWPAGRLIGRLTLRDVRDQAARLGIYLHPDECNRGYGSAALRLLLDIAPTLGLTRLRLDVASDNVRAIRCYEKCGFVVVGETERGGIRLLEMECSFDPSAHTIPGRAGISAGD